MFQQALSFIAAHQVLATFIACGVLTAAISTMPSPDATSGKGYIWAFNFLHAVMGMLGRIPQLRQFMPGQNGNGK